MDDTQALRRQLRAFEYADSCRVAFLLLQLGITQGKTIEREAVVEAWAGRYPRHVSRNDSLLIRRRIRTGLRHLRRAGVVREKGERISVRNMGHLQLSAGNLSIVEDEKGFACPPKYWLRQPAVPPRLRSAQRVVPLLQSRRKK